MKKLKLKKAIAIMLTAFSISSLHVLNADAAWMQDSNGWWNSEGSSWSIGWRMIDGQWYYFGSDGYMKTGWLSDGGKWYYLQESGAMAQNTTVDGYKLGEDGAWIDKQSENNSLNSTTDIKEDDKVDLKSDKVTDSSNMDKDKSEDKKEEIEDKSDSKDILDEKTDSSDEDTTYEPAEANRTVYWTSGGKSYHYNKDCPTLARSKKIYSGKFSECPKSDPCDKCVK